MGENAATKLLNELLLIYFLILALDIIYESTLNAAQENGQIPVVQTMLLPNICAIMSSRRTTRHVTDSDR